MSEDHVRDGFRTITPYLIVDNVAAVLAFIAEAFDAEVIMQLPREDGSIMHAEARIGDANVMMGEPTETFGAMPGSLYLYVPDCDAVFARALRAGGVSVMEPTTMTHAGQRYGGVRDPGGSIWWVATHLEDVTEAEEKRRLAARDT